MAVDYGTVRVGVAISDPGGIISQPLETIPCSSDRAVIRRLKYLVHEYEIGLILVGNPLSMSSKATAISVHVQQFVKRLRKTIKLDVKLWDERLTSKYARVRLKEVGIHKTSERIDQIAACIILDEYLKSQPQCSA